MGGKCLHILHVDDEPDFADMAAAYLEREDDQFDVDTATSAAEGLDRLVEADYDCVISDYDMPRMDGIEFLDAVREDFPDLPFILFTGKGSEEVASDAISAGVTDYLQKASGTSQYELLANRVRNAVEQFRTERRAHLRERQHRELFEQAPIMYIFTRDIDGQLLIEDCNDQLIEKLGYDRDEMIGRPISEFYTEESRRKMHAEGGYERALDDEFGLEERTLVTKDGERIHVINRANPRLDRHGNPVGVQAMYLDITERKRHERERRNERDRLAALFENAPRPMFEGAVDPTDQFRIVDVNDAFEETFGYASEEIVGRDPLDALVPDQERARYDRLRDRVLAGESFSTEVERTTIDGDRTFLLDVVSYGTEPTPADGWFASYTDVTARKDREEDLELYETMIETVPDGVYALDEDLRYIAVNQGMVDLTGYSKEELIGSHLSLINTDEAVESAERNRERVHDGDGEIDDGIRVVEHPHLTVAGEAIPCEVRFRALPPAEDGSFRGTAGVIRDITERKKHEGELEEYREYTDRLLDAIDDLFYVHDENGAIRRWNEAFAETTDYSDEELASMDAVEVIAEDHRERTAERIEKVFETGHARLEAPLLTKDGSTIPYEFVADRVEHPNGEPRLVGIGRDITERVEAEAQLRRERNRLAALFENAPRPIVEAEIRADDSRPIVRVNDAFTDVFGYDAAEIVGRDIADVLVPADEQPAHEQFRERGAAGESFSAEVKRTTVDGEQTFLLDVVPYGTESTPADGAFGLYTDITERDEREQELQRERDRLDKFASVVSHDLRNPLNVAEGNVELAREECDSEHLDTVARALDRMDTLLVDLLTLAHQGTSVEDVEPVGLADVVEACWGNVDTADATLTVHTEQTIRADRSRLAQLLENLVRNAAEHGRSDVTVTVGDLDDGTGFYVEDDGPGIPADERDDVFEHGYSTAADGTGFGLAIVKEIAEAHGWDVTLTESDAGGARFEITGVESVA